MLSFIGRGVNFKTAYPAVPDAPGAAAPLPSAYASLSLRNVRANSTNITAAKAAG
jgi:hypothetical protein